MDCTEGLCNRIVPDLHSLRMSPPAVEERHDFSEHVGGCYEARQRSHDTLPVLCGRLMVPVVGTFESHEITCVHKYGIHRS